MDLEQYKIVAGTNTPKSSFNYWMWRKFTLLLF